MNANVELSESGEASIQSFLGDLSALAERLGVHSAALNGFTNPDCWSSLVVRDRQSLETFLKGYRENVLVPIELPAIVESAGHVAKGRLRELQALDQRLTQCAEIKAFSEASRWVGLCHARSMLGMKDHRVVQRYCESVNGGESCGWHSVVYGVVLGAFAIPLRQGLLNYCERMTRSFVESAAPRIGLSAEGGALVVRECMRGLQDQVSDSLEKSGAPTAIRAI